MNAKETLAATLFDSGAVKLSPEAPFTFASGIQSPIYCDNRALLARPEWRKTVVSVFVDAIRNSAELDSDIIAGVATAGIPWGALIADILGKPMSYVRGAAKGHGTKKQIEGADVAGKSVLLIEDLLSTGKSCLEAAGAVAENKAAAIAVAAIFSYEMDTCTDAMTAAGIPFTPMLTFPDLLDYAVMNNKIRDKDRAVILNWKVDPAGWYDRHFG